jgi:ABC-type branched-subunit amino acid transport system ATPase component
VDKNISELLELTDYNLILEKGALVWHGRTDDLEKSPEIIDRFLYL